MYLGWTTKRIRALKCGGGISPEVMPSPFPGTYPTRIAIEVKLQRASGHGRHSKWYIGKPNEQAYGWLRNMMRRGDYDSFTFKEFDRVNLVCSGSRLGGDGCVVAHSWNQDLQRFYRPQTVTLTFVGLYEKLFSTTQWEAKKWRTDTPLGIVKVYTVKGDMPKQDFRDEWRKWLAGKVGGMTKDTTLRAMKEPTLPVWGNWTVGSR